MTWINVGTEEEPNLVNLERTFNVFLLKYDIERWQWAFVGVADSETSEAVVYSSRFKTREDAVRWLNDTIFRSREKPYVRENKEVRQNEYTD